MADTLECAQMQEALGLIRQVKTRFDKAFEEAIKSGDPGEARKFKKELDTNIEVLRNKMGVTPAEANDYIREHMNEKAIFGPRDIEETFGFIPRRVPKVQFAPEELKEANKRGEKLILYLNRLPGGKELTLGSLIELLRAKNDKAPFSLREYEKEDFFHDETARLSWTLVATQENLGGLGASTFGEDYLTQLSRIDAASGLLRKLEKDVSGPLDEARREYDEKIKVLEKDLRGPRWVKNSEDIANLKLNQLSRESLVEAVWRLMMQQTKKDRSDASYTWTKTRMANGTFVKVKMLKDKPGLAVNEQQPGVKERDTGATLVRNV